MPDLDYDATAAFELVIEPLAVRPGVLVIHDVTAYLDRARFLSGHLDLPTLPTLPALPDALARRLSAAREQS